MPIIPWNVPIKAPWTRANDLKELRFDRKNLSLALTEEETEQVWIVTFKFVQAFRLTTEESAGYILEKLPSAGGFFEAIDSPWIQELGKGESHFLDKSRHFIICCYDEIIEVVAWEFTLTAIG